VITTLGFAVVAICALVSAIFVVRSADLIRAVLWLGITLIATAALYAMLGASFLAGVQLLLYVGGVMTLMVFGVMITRRHVGIATTTTDTVHPVRGAIVALALFGVVANAIVKTEGLDTAPAVPLAPLTLVDLGNAILHEHVLAFEVLSLLLLAAIIGAVVIARRHDPGPATAPSAPGTRKEASR
jgi:NADH-quinone oxidoreductase subunit J